MGLDMYLTRKKYVGAEYEHRKVKGVVYITIGDKELPIDFDRISYIEESVGYWRKANQIHNYIVENFNDGIDNCRPIWLYLEDLEKILKVCKEVKKSIKLVDGKVENGYSFNEKGEKEYHYTDGKIIEDASVCEELLPTTSGCFFGNTQYNEWYLEDIDYTIKLLSKLIKEEKQMNKDGIFNEFEYRASW